MNRKISLLITALFAQGLIENVHAKNSSPQNAVQFYAGLSGGIEWMDGKRTDSLNEDIGGARTITNYADNLNVRRDNAVISAIGGFMWKLPSVPLLIGPEIFFGRGNALSSVRDSRLDPFNETRFYVADFQRKHFYGILARAGYQFCNSYLAYLALGWEQGRFSLFRAISADQVNATPTSISDTSKTLNAILFGLGIEKRISPFNVGLDFRISRYQRITSLGKINPLPPLGTGDLYFSFRPQVYTAALRISYEF